jgi:hypothetical protein
MLPWSMPKNTNKKQKQKFGANTNKQHVVDFDFI